MENQREEISTPDETATQDSGPNWFDAVNAVVPFRLLTEKKDASSLPGMSLTDDVMTGARVAGAVAGGAIRAAIFPWGSATETGVRIVDSAARVAGAAAASARAGAFLGGAGAAAAAAAGALGDRNESKKK